MGGISSLAGAMATGGVTRRLGIGPAMIVGLLLSSIAMFFIPLAQGATLTAALLLILQQISGDGPATIYQINEVSLRQAIAPERLLGRVNASAEFLRLSATLAGSLLGGLIGGWIGVRSMLFVASFGTLLSTFWWCSADPCPAQVSRLSCRTYKLKNLQNALERPPRRVLVLPESRTKRKSVGSRLARTMLCMNLAACRHEEKTSGKPTNDCGCVAWRLEVHLERASRRSQREQLSVTPHFLEEDFGPAS